MSISNINKKTSEHTIAAVYKGKTAKIDETDKMHMPQTEHSSETDTNLKENRYETQKVKSAVIIKISDESRKIAEEAEKSKNTNKFEEINNKTDIERMREELENARKSGEALAEEFEVLRKCLIIAMRIICGDKVPKTDHTYLAEKNPSLYGKALMMRIERKDPKDYERISADEKPLENSAEKPSSDSVIEPKQPEISVEVQSETEE